MLTWTGIWVSAPYTAELNATRQAKTDVLPAATRRQDLVIMALPPFRPSPLRFLESRSPHRPRRTPTPKVIGEANEVPDMAAVFFFRPVELRILCVNTDASGPHSARRPQVALLVLNQLDRLPRKVPLRVLTDLEAVVGLRGEERRGRRIEHKRLADDHQVVPRPRVEGRER